MNNLMLLQLLAEFAGAVCEEILDCEELDIDADMEASAGGVKITINAEKSKNSRNADRKITEEDLDRECNKHYDCCDCPYDDYCSEGEDDDE